MIRAVLFDLDGTIYDRDAVVEAIVEDQLTTFGESLSGVDEARYRARVLELDAHGYCLTREVFATIGSEFGLAAGTPEQLVSHFWENFDRFCRLTNDARMALETLKEHGLKLGVITNGTVERQGAKLRTLGLAGFFDVVLISQAEGLQKPDPKIFWRAVEQCGVRPEEAIFVGDHPDLDVAGAVRAGLLPVWRRVPYWEMKTEGAKTINSLSEILPICLSN